MLRPRRLVSQSAYAALLVSMHGWRLYERRDLEAKIKVALGGRSAEEIVYDEPTTGAESDISS